MRTAVPDEETPPGEATAALTLSEAERTVLEALRSLPDHDRVDEETLSTELDLPIEAVRGSLQRLRSKHLAVVDEEHLEMRRLTPRGEEAIRTGLPERRLLGQLTASPLEPAATPGERAGLTEDEWSAAIGLLRRRGFLAEGVPLRLREPSPVPSVPFPEEVALTAVRDASASVDAAVFALLKRRGLVAVDRRSVSGGPRRTKDADCIWRPRTAGSSGP